MRHNTSSDVQRQMKVYLQSTETSYRRLFVGGIPLAAMHKYVPMSERCNPFNDNVEPT